MASSFEKKTTGRVILGALTAELMPGENGPYMRMIERGDRRGARISETGLPGPAAVGGIA